MVVISLTVIVTNGYTLYICIYLFIFIIRLKQLQAEKDSLKSKMKHGTAPSGAR